MYISWGRNEFELAKNYFRHLTAVCKSEMVYIVTYSIFYWVNNFYWAVYTSHRSKIW